jgi:ketosteroid isomerase-like protein
MPPYDDTFFVDRFLEPWKQHDVDGALALMTDDCVWEITKGREPHDAQHQGSGAGRLPYGGR